METLKVVEAGEDQAVGSPYHEAARTTCAAETDTDVDQDAPSDDAEARKSSELSSSASREQNAADAGGC